VPHKCACAACGARSLLQEMQGLYPCNSNPVPNASAVQNLKVPHAMSVCCRLPCPLDH
jgi:hypothetical protein